MVKIQQKNVNRCAVVCAAAIVCIASANAGEAFSNLNPHSKQASIADVAHVAHIAPQPSSISIQPTQGPLPKNQAAQILAEGVNHDFSGDSDRLWPQLSYRWQAPAVAYRPLYFEEEHLERYGHHHGIIEPAISAAKFFGRIPALPYMVGATPCKECQYPLGYYRPGDCAPLYTTHPKASLRGAAYQAAAVTGAVFVIP